MCYSTTVTFGIIFLGVSMSPQCKVISSPGSHIFTLINPFSFSNDPQEEVNAPPTRCLLGGARKHLHPTMKSVQILRWWGEKGDLT